MEHVTLEHVTFLPHKLCWLNTTELIWMHALGDGLTWLAYWAIPVVLIYVARTYRFKGTLRTLFRVYGLFIFLCGTTHLFDLIMIWEISYTLLWWDGLLRDVTAVVSIISAILTARAAATTLHIVGEFLRLQRDYKNANFPQAAKLESLLKEIEGFVNAREEKQPWTSPRS